MCNASRCVTLQCSLYLLYSAEVSVFFRASFLIICPIELLHSQPFTNSRFLFLVIVKYEMNGQIHECAGGLCAFWHWKHRVQSTWVKKIWHWPWVSHRHLHVLINCSLAVNKVCNMALYSPAFSRESRCKFTDSDSVPAGCRVVLWLQREGCRECACYGREWRYVRWSLFGGCARSAKWAKTVQVCKKSAALCWNWGGPKTL
jgi:hypothetical protein